MAVSQIESVAVQPYEDGVSFGDVGPYEVVRAVLRYAVDPDDRRGPADRRPRPRPARVRPASSASTPISSSCGRSTRTRAIVACSTPSPTGGRPTSLPLSIGAFAAPACSARIEPGDGFLLRRGYTVAWSGWQWDIDRRPGLVGLAAPEALDDDGVPIAGPVRVRVQPATAYDTVRLAVLSFDPKLAPPRAVPARRSRRHRRGAHRPGPSRRRLVADRPGVVAVRRFRPHRARRWFRGGPHLRGRVPHRALPDRGRRVPGGARRGVVVAPRERGRRQPRRRARRLRRSRRERRSRVASCATSSPTA